jgi:type II secretory pathway pseudopilin PulG
MSQESRSGMKLIDLMVAVIVIAVLLAVVPPFLRVQRSTRCYRNVCQDNMRQLGLALLNFSMNKNHLPNAGTLFDDAAVHHADPSKSNLYRAVVDPGALAGGPAALRYNWVVDILPYLDQPDFANAWDRKSPYWSTTTTVAGQPPNAILSGTSLSVLKCPNDRDAEPNQGNLSYVVNGGFARWYPIPVGWAGSEFDGQSTNGPVLRWTPTGSWKESLDIGKKLGVMFLGTTDGDQPWDVRTTPGDLVDGANFTLLVGENTLAGYSKGSPYANGLSTNWACPLPNFAMFVGSDDVCRSPKYVNDCLGGQLRPPSATADGPGWSRANGNGSFERIDFGQTLTVKGSFPFVTSAHETGANFIFCDGSCRFLTDTIDGTVYAKLITPAGSQLPGAIRQGSLSAAEFDP